MSVHERAPSQRTGRADGPRLISAETRAEPAELSPAQRELVDQAIRGRHALLALGGPGTGKTTALVAAVLARVRSGTEVSRTVVLTGSRWAAQQLRTRIVAELGGTQRGLQITTVHGWCAQLQHRFATPTEPAPRLLTAPEQEFRVRELVSAEQNWPTELAPALGTRGFARELRRLLARVRQLGFDPADLAAAGRRTNRPQWQAAARFCDEYLDVLDAEGVVDYAELVHRTRLLLLDTEVRAALPMSAEVIFVDEFAEFDRGMIRLLADAHRLGCRVVAAADPSTRVFGFRGADGRAVPDFGSLFDLPGAPAASIVLGESLRCDRGLARVQQRLAARIPAVAGAPARVGPSEDARVDRQQEPVPGQPPVSVVLLDDEAAQADHIASVLRRARVIDQLNWSEMAVITRAGSGRVTTLARRLSSAGVPVRVAGDEVALVAETPVRELLAVLTASVELAGTGQLDTRTAARLLLGPVGGLDAVGLRLLGRELRGRAAAQADEVSSSEVLVATELTRQVLAGDCEEHRQVVELVRLRSLLNRLAGDIDKRVEVTTLLWRAWSGTDWPDRLRRTALGGGPNAPRANRDLDAVVGLFDLASRGQHWVGAGGVRALVAEVAGQQIPADTSRESDPRSGAVQVLTVHRAKGQQWPLVVLAGLQEGQWPAPPSGPGLLGADLLTADGDAVPSLPSAQITDERRSFLLGVSRASQRLVVTGVDDPSGASDPPSRFIRELGVEVQRVRGQPGADTLAGLVARLRRVATDPASPPGLVEQAAGELAWLAAQTDDDGRALVPAADPEHWWTLRQRTRPGPRGPKPIRLSGSQVETLLACPRRWFATIRARAGRPSGAAAVLGQVVHALIALDGSGDTDDRGVHERLDEVWQRIQFDAAWQSDTQRQAALDAFAAYRRWASDPQRGRVLGRELGFEVPVDLGGRKVLLTGSIDRLEVDRDQRLRVVDFKTSRTAAAADKVASMDQLGSYQLAVRLGAFDELTGGRRALASAEAVYLRATGAGGHPTVRSQPSLDDRPRLDDQPATPGHTWVHDRLAEAAEIVATEQFWALPNAGCRHCQFHIGCPATEIGVE